jgi:hypothetical protein
MPGKAPIDAVNTIHDALENLDKQGQLKALQAAIMLLGITPESIGLTRQTASIDRDSDKSESSGAGEQRSGSGSSGQVGTAAEYFRKKDPQGLMEVLAVAARYRELVESAESHTKEELDAVFRAARRNAPANFARDLKNAKQQQYFNSGTDIVLSHYGQSYVDKLPDREAAKAVTRPKKRGGPKKKAKAT